MPSALCGQLLTIFSRPIIRNIVSMGWKTALVGRAVSIGLRGNVEDDGFLLADAFPSMIDPVGHLNTQRVVDADEKFIDLPLGRRTFSRTGKDQLDHPLEGADVIGLDLMIVPGLYHLRIGGANIHLA